jgi:polar amino acid transport system substrate-binding protein
MTALPSGRLRLACSDIDARPLFWNEGDRRCGYEPEAAHEVADALGVDVEWIYTPWDDRWPAVLDGRADAVWCGMAVTPERASVMGFSIPYATFNESLVVRADCVVASPRETAGMCLGVPANSTNERLARTWADVEVRPYAGYDDVFTAMIEDTAARIIDGFVDDEPAVVPLADRDPRLKIAFSVPTRLPWAAAVRAGNNDLIELLNNGITAATNNGSLARQWERHLPFLDFPFAEAG